MRQNWNSIRDSFMPLSFQSREGEMCYDTNRAKRQLG